MDLKVTMLSETRQTKIDKHCVILLICGMYKTNRHTKNKINEQAKSKKNKYVDSENRVVVTEGKWGQIE